MAETIKFNMHYLLTSDTEESWKESDPVIPKKLLVADETGKKLKLGNGASKWSELPYLGDSEINELRKEIAAKADSGQTLTEYGITDAYTKSEVDEKITDVTTKIEALPHMKVEVVEKTLPETGEQNIIYLVPKDPSNVDKNGYTEYLFINEEFEKIGDTEIDLSGYVQTEDLENYVTDNDLSNYVQTEALQDYLKSSELESKLTPYLKTSDFGTQLQSHVDGTTIEYGISDNKIKVKDGVFVKPESYGTSTTGGTIKSSTDQNKIKVNTDGTAEVNEISFLKLKINEGDTVTIDGGDASSIKAASV